GGGQTGKFLTGDAGNTVFAFSGGNFDIRAGTGGSASQNVVRVTSVGNIDINGTLASGVITQSGTTLANTYQPLDDELTSLAALSYVSASFVKMTGANTFALRTIAETADDLEGMIVHDNLAGVHQGVTTGDSPLFTAVSIGNADTTITRVSAGLIAVEGTTVMLVGDAPTAHVHDGDTLQLDGINSNGGAFSFLTTGDVTFNQNLIISKHLALGGASIDSDILLLGSELLTDTDNSEKYGMHFDMSVAKTTAAMTSVGRGGRFECALDASNTQDWTNSIGLRGLQGRVRTLAGSSGTITGIACFYTSITVANAAQVTNAYGFYLNRPSLSGGKTANLYGIYMENH
ncbi:hypothetical protein LCGC14_3100410, partial [marine sediment metagenome]